MGLYINMEMPKDSDMIVIYSDGTARKYLSYTKVIIDEAKAISIHATDMQPVVKATWIMPNADGTDRPMPECSHCGWYVDNGGVKDFSFCPNCGARMEGN